MRPGLHKPGALPLLIVIVFSLLTLVPSLPSISSLKLADLSYLVYRGRQVPLIQDNVVDISCTDTHRSDSRTPWIPAIPSRPRINRSPRSARLANGAPMVSSETAPVENRSRSSVSASEPSFLFSRRAHAFRTYFIQQLDDYQLLSPFSTRMSNGAIPDSNPTLPSTYHAPLPTAIDASNVDSIFQSYNESTYSMPPSVPKGQLAFGGMWQQVCQTASDLWELANESPNFQLPRLIELGTYYAKSTFLSNATTAERPTVLIPPPNVSHSESQECPDAPAPMSKSHTQSNDVSADAAGRHSSQLQGSCMAVVIGLVAAIVWF